MRQTYCERRRVLIESIQAEFGDFFTVHGSSAGMHVSVTLPDGFNDLDISIRAAKERLLLFPLTRYYAGKKPRHGFVLGFGSTSTEQIPSAVKRMRAVVPGDAAGG